MSAPFRDLFVELPRAIFEALQGIGEQAVRNARPPTPHHRPSAAFSLMEATNGKWLADWLCERFGWKRIEMWRSARDRDLMLMVRLECGHNTEFPISESSLELAHPTNIVDLIADCWEQAGRGCRCVVRP